jgi:hypothetical protein
MSQRDLAEKIDTAHVSIGRYERYQTPPDLEVLARIAFALSTDIPSLVARAPLETGQGEKPGLETKPRTPPPRRTPGPWSVREIAGGYVVVDANGRRLAYIFGDTDGRVAQSIAHYPEVARQLRESRMDELDHAVVVLERTFAKMSQDEAEDEMREVIALLDREDLLDTWPRLRSPQEFARELFSENNNWRLTRLVREKDGSLEDGWSGSDPDNWVSPTDLITGLLPSDGHLE